MTMAGGGLMTAGFGLIAMSQFNNLNVAGLPPGALAVLGLGSVAAGVAVEASASIEKGPVKKR